MMNRQLKYFVGMDFILRLSGLSSMIVFIAFVYQLTGRSSDIGFISLATFIPSLLVTVYSGVLFKKWNAPVILQGTLIARVVLFLAAAFLVHSSLGIFLVAAIHSLFYQISLVAKMSCDAQLIDEKDRAQYLSSKMLFANICIILGPPLGGILASQLSAFGTMMILMMGNVFLLFGFQIRSVDWYKKSFKPLNQKNDLEPNLDTSKKLGFMDCYRYLKTLPWVFLVVISYCMVAMILEIQSPLIFPFTKEVFGKGSDFASMLLGAAGVGGVVGSLLPLRFPKIFHAKSIPYLVLFDGLIFSIFTLSSSTKLSVGLFLLLGIMGAVTLLLVESTVQSEVRSEYQPTVFSLMQFAGGAGGATLGIFAAYLAEIFGSQITLFGAAIIEIGIGAAGLLTFWWVKKVSNV
jgi:predicted MFS family arabinose efflux permease